VYKTSTKKKNLKDISHLELTAYWNGPNTTKCNSIVMQALNFPLWKWIFVLHQVMCNDKCTKFLQDWTG